MGLGDFAKSMAGSIGFAGGAALGGPIGAAIGGGIGGKIEGDYRNKKQFERDKYWYDQQTNTQKEFAQKGIQWKVKDAKAAGIHPLAALGAQTYNASPAQIGGTPLVNEGGSMASMGQDIGRAIMSQQTSHQRKMMDLQLKNAQMDTEMKSIDLSNARKRVGQGGQLAPGLPDQVITKPAEITSHVRGRKNIEAGSVTSTGYARTAGGGLTPVPSKDVKERIEDQMIPEMVWSAQNYLGPAVGKTDTKPPKKYLPKGYKDWEFSIKDATWYPVKHKGRTPWQKLKTGFKRKKNIFKSWYNKRGRK